MDEESKTALLETRRTEFPDDPPYLVADKLLAREFLNLIHIIGENPAPSSVPKNLEFV